MGKFELIRKQFSCEVLRGSGIGNAVGEFRSAVRGRASTSERGEIGVTFAGQVRTFHSFSFVDFVSGCFNPPCRRKVHGFPAAWKRYKQPHALKVPLIFRY